MVEKLKNETYKITVSLDPGDFEINGDKEVIGNFKIEVFEKNFGTFEEDTTTRENIEVEELFIQNKKTNWESLNHRDRLKILDYVIDNAKEQLRIYQDGE